MINEDASLALGLMYWQLLKVQSKSQYVAVLCSPTISFNFKPRPETKNIIKFGSFPGLAGDCSSRSAPDSLIPVHRNQLGRVAQIFPPPPPAQQLSSRTAFLGKLAEISQHYCCLHCPLPPDSFPIHWDCSPLLGHCTHSYQSDSFILSRYF